MDDAAKDRGWVNPDKMADILGMETDEYLSKDVMELSPPRVEDKEDHDQPVEKKSKYNAGAIPRFPVGYPYQRMPTLDVGTPC